MGIVLSQLLQDLRTLDCSCRIHRAYRGRDAPPTAPSVPHKRVEGI